MMDMRKIAEARKTPHWYSIANKTGDTATIRIDGVIGGDWFGDGVTAKAFAAEFAAISAAKIDLHVNSEGGNVFDGLAIYNLIRGSGKSVTAHVDGLAASISAVIVMAAGKIVMPENAFLMIHRPWMCGCGNADALRDAAKTLDEIGEQLEKIISDRSSQPERIPGLMVGERGDGTWINAELAAELGFADEIIENVKAAACVGADVFDNLPDAVRRLNGAADKRELERRLRGAGYSETQARAIASGHGAPREGVGDDDVAGWREIMEQWKNEVLS